MRCTVLLSTVMLVALAAFIPVHAAPMNEQQKIEALLNDVEMHDDLRFIRLGSVHSSAEAARMLRIKLRFAGARIRTADEFIDYIATATASGSPYFVLYPNGRRVPSGEFLRAELKRITQAPGGLAAPR
jgi:hypothetical protein